MSIVSPSSSTAPPQIPLPPLDLDEQLVQMPGVALAAAAVPQQPCVVNSECQAPLPNRLIRHGDSPFGEEIFDISKAQAKAVVEPDGVTDDCRGESVSAIAGRDASVAECRYDSGDEF